jgi:hypothetical protein
MHITYSYRSKFSDLLSCASGDVVTLEVRVDAMWAGREVGGRQLSPNTLRCSDLLTGKPVDIIFFMGRYSCSIYQGYLSPSPQSFDVLGFPIGTSSCSVGPSSPGRTSWCTAGSPCPPPPPPRPPRRLDPSSPRPKPYLKHRVLKYVQNQNRCSYICSWSGYYLMRVLLMSDHQSGHIR